MRRVILFLAAIVLGLWSLFCWAVYNLLGFAGGIASANIGLIPFPPEIVLWTVDILGGVGAVSVWIVWLLGAAAIGMLALIPLAFTARQPPRPAVDLPREDLYRAPAEQPGRPVDPRSADDVVAKVLGRSPRG